MNASASYKVYDHLPTQEDLYSAYFLALSKENRRQEIIRPSVAWARVLRNAVIPIGLCGALVWGCNIVGFEYLRWIPMVALLLYAILRTRQILIFFIMVYQRYAPTRVRQSCLFEPTCSEYMRLAVEKYGLRKGFVKGMNRLRRCKAPNGGVDWP